MKKVKIDFSSKTIRFQLVLILILVSPIAISSGSPASITGYSPGEIISKNDVLYVATYFDSEIVAKDYIVKSKSKKSKLPISKVSAVLTGDNKLTIFKIQVVVDVCDAVKFIKELDLPDAQKKENKKKRMECESAAKGLHAQLKGVYGTKYNYYSTSSIDENFDPDSVCAVAIKSIHGAILKCKEWSTPKANRLGVYLNNLIEAIQSGSNYEYGDTLQTTFEWHDELLEQKLRKRGEALRNKNEAEKNKKASEKINLFD